MPKKETKPKKKEGIAKEPLKTEKKKAAVKEKIVKEKKAIIPEKPEQKKAAPEKIEPELALPSEGHEAAGGRYWEAVGRRKTAIARVRLFTRGDKGIWVNDKPADRHFQYPGLQGVVEEPLKKMKSQDRFRVSAKVKGGGIHAQAEAIRHGISRALVKFNPDFRKRLKRAGFLTRDPRMKERKKFGLKGARRAPQWAKR